MTFWLFVLVVFSVDALGIVFDAATDDEYDDAVPFPLLIDCSMSSVKLPVT